MGQVIKLLKIANNDLSRVQLKSEQLIKDVISLGFEKQKSTKVSQELNNSPNDKKDYQRHVFI